MAALGISALVVSISLPHVMDRTASRRGYLLGGCLVTAVAVLGMLMSTKWGWHWALLAGASLAVLFAVGLVLPIDASRTPEEAAAVSGLASGSGTWSLPSRREVWACFET